MIVDAATYVTDRIAASAAESAADRVGPKVIWGVAIVMFGVAGLVFGLSALHTYLASIYGSLHAALAIAGACTLLALTLLVVPWAFRKASRASSENGADTQSALAAVDEEARDAIDYFGAAKVLATAFMFGFSAARKIRQ
ncbi:MAG: hypothetical protein KDJ47_16645 [Hyphomicrobiaceae bacterium]|nr:hypothetical protein [Hyphomicrobiaceae bacterium]